MRLIFRVGLIALFSALTSAGRSYAGDVEDVKAAYAQHIANTNAANADAFIRQHMPGHTAFGPDGALLTQFDTFEEEKQARPDLSKPRTAFTRVRHLDAKVYGNAAVVTGYLLAPVALPDGKAKTETRRVTSVWVKQGGDWKEVHDHMSPLLVSR